MPDLNVLINNAGISRQEDLTLGNGDISVATSLIQTNIVSVLQLTSALLPTLSPHQATDPHAMPLVEFIAEVIAILDSPDLPDGEILVERVKALRWAERNNSYDQMFGILNQ